MRLLRTPIYHLWDNRKYVQVLEYVRLSVARSAVRHRSSGLGAKTLYVTSLHILFSFLQFYSQKFIPKLEKFISFTKSFPENCKIFAWYLFIISVAVYSGRLGGKSQPSSTKIAWMACKPQKVHSDLERQTCWNQPSMGSQE